MTLFTIFLAAATFALPLAGAVRLADPFADGMVLQRERPVPIWGTAVPGEKVTVNFSEHKVEAVAGGDGRWMCRLPPLRLSNEPCELTATAGESKQTVGDVLVGDVWFVSGQSNCEFPLCSDNPHFSDRNGAAIASITHMPLVRYCYQSDYRISATPKDRAALPVEWRRFEPKNLLVAPSFSAIGFYFAMHVHQATGVPLGLVGAYWGGTGIDPWTPREGTATRPDLKDILDFPVSENWDGVTPKSIFRFSRKQDQPAVLFNEMVNPWCPFAMKGLVWYQGCMNSREPERYCSKMHALYNGWSQKFENPDMRLYFVQLAPWGFEGIAEIQEAQAEFEREQPNSGMAVINDVGNLTDIHPNEKGTVGLRLARMALKRDYGFDDIEDRSPMLKSWRIEGDSFVLDFDHARRLYVYTRNYSADAPFEIAGADGVFRPAKIVNAIEDRVKTGGGEERTEYRGRIDGGSRLVVRSDEVRQPMRLRYCHSHPWLGTVYNEANLPLGAFHVGRIHPTIAEVNLSFYISNHDQSPLHRVIHPIVGQTNFVYDAKGALEKICGEAIAFYVRDSENVTIRNLRLDWERPCMTEAKIVDIDGGETIVEIDRRRFPVTFIDGRMWMTGPGWTNETKYCKLFDGKTREQTAMAGDIAFDGTARELPDGRVAFKHDFSKDGVGAKIGDVITFRPTRRDFPAIVVYGSKNVTLEDVVVHDAKGMALIAQRSENIMWRGTKTAADKTAGVFPRSGSYASSHADASHFSNVKGTVTVENCWFEGMMDDAINVHSTCLAVTNVVRGDTLCCRYMHEQSVGFEVFRSGETLRFIDGDTLETGPEIRVRAVRQLGERDVEVTLETPPPDGWGVGDAVENADYQCAATFRGNVVCNNRARGSLFTTPRPVLVESNLFSKVTGSAILFAGDDYYWYESGACRDVVIRGNVFSNCCTAASRHGYSKGIISFYPIVRDFERQKKRFHGNILVEDNEFSGFDVPLLFAISAENIKWRNNHVSYNDLYTGWEEPPFVLKHCRNVEINGSAIPGDTKIHTAPRCESDFNDGWEFRREPDETWHEVRVPHDWAIESRFDPNGEPGAGRLPYTGTGWYRKRFTLPDESDGQCVFLDVGGAMTESDVWLNGILVGGRKFGFSSYRVNLTSALRPAGKENLVEIRCHVPAKSARFYFGAGLYRPLRLVRTPPVHVGRSGVFAKTKILADGSAIVDAEVDVKGPLAFVNAGARNTFKFGDVRIESRVLGEDGLRIRTPKLWSPESPHLYTLETRLTYAGTPVDTVYTKFGVRSLMFDPKRGFFLNGKYRQMKGVCLHHDLGSLGAAFDRGAFERQIKIMKEMGADAIRTSHNPPDPAALDVCDEMGMLVMDEAFDCWSKHKFPADYATWFQKWHNKDFADLVLRDRNHPCVVMWSIGNEIPDTYEKPVPAEAIRIGKELTAIAHRLDPMRPTTMGHCRSFTMTNGMEKATDIYGANYLPSDYEWYLKSGEGRLGLIATETCSAVSTRGGNDLKVFRKNNYLPEVEFAAQTNNPACYGEFVWTGFDYLGEPDPYSEKGARSSYYGIVDLCGFPKERYWTYRAHWRPDNPGRPEAESSGPVVGLELTKERFRDLVFVKIRAVDAGRATVTNFNDRLAFVAKGAVAIAGVCNGDPMDYDSLHGDSIKAFRGLAQVILRGATGELRVSSRETGDRRLSIE